jgi:predicted Zn-dependent protease
MECQRFPCVALILLLATLFVTTSCAVNPVTGEQEIMLLSESDEIRLGRKTDGEIEKAYGLYGDHGLGGYVLDLGQRIAQQSHRSLLAFDFKVLDSSVVNAFAVPGGYVYLTRGILSYLNSEAELAGVIGHEIGHIAARHSAQRLSKAQLTQLGLGVGSVLSQTFREYASVAQFGVSVLFLKFSRDDERQADDLGVEYASKAGFDASQMANFFDTLERLNPSSDRSGLPSWLSTHPNPPDRIGAVQRKARQWADQLGRPDLLVNREAYLRKIDGLAFGEDPRQGYLDDDVFYHPGMRFLFPVPPGWKLKNTPSEVKVVSPKGDAVISLTLVSGTSAKAIAEKFTADPNARVLDQDNNAINGLPARQVVADIATQQGTVRVLSYFIQKDALVYIFHAFSDEPAFHSFVSTFGRSLNGFADLTDPKRIHVQPDRIRIRATKTTTTLDKALTQLGVPKERLKDVALLNGKHLHETIPAKTLLKIVENG